MTPEGKVKAKISAWLKKRDMPYWCIIPSPMGRSTGVSDYIAILKDGRLLAIEAKAEGKEKNVTANQQAFLDTVNANNGVGVVVSCQADLDELEKRLND